MNYKLSSCLGERPFRYPQVLLRAVVYAIATAATIWMAEYGPVTVLGAYVAGGLNVMIDTIFAAT